MSILIADLLRVSAQLWMFSMHAAAMLFMCCSQVIVHAAHPAFPFATSKSGTERYRRSPSGAIFLAASLHKPRPASRGGFLHPIRHVFLQECRCRPLDAASFRISERPIHHQSLSSVMADHDLLLHFIAPIPHGSKQGCRRLDAPVCIKSFTMEQAVYVVALVRF
jgi:hypothetical protein